MKRPGVAEKKTADPEHEPDFYAISDMYPLPEKVEEDESILLQCTLQGGPRARVPIYSGPSAGMAAMQSMRNDTATAGANLWLGGDFNQRAFLDTKQPPALGTNPAPAPGLSSFLSTPAPAASLQHSLAGAPAAASAAAAVAAHHARLSAAISAANHHPVLGLPHSTSAAASQFAAGFAAATAYSQQQFRIILDNLAQQKGGGGGGPPGYPGFP